MRYAEADEDRIDDEGIVARGGRSDCRLDRGGIDKEEFGGGSRQGRQLHHHWSTEIPSLTTAAEGAKPSAWPADSRFAICTSVSYLREG